MTKRVPLLDTASAASMQQKHLRIIETFIASENSRELKLAKCKSNEKRQMLEMEFALERAHETKLLQKIMQKGNDDEKVEEEVKVMVAESARRLQDIDRAHFPTTSPLRAKKLATKQPNRREKATTSMPRITRAAPKTNAVQKKSVDPKRATLATSLPAPREHQSSRMKLPSARMEVEKESLKDSQISPRLMEEQKPPPSSFETFFNAFVGSPDAMFTNVKEVVLDVDGFEVRVRKKSNSTRLAEATAGVRGVQALKEQIERNVDTSDYYVETTTLEGVEHPKADLPHLPVKKLTSLSNATTDPKYCVTKCAHPPLEPRKSLTKGILKCPSNGRIHDGLSGPMSHDLKDQVETHDAEVTNALVENKRQNISGNEAPNEEDNQPLQHVSAEDHDEPNRGIEESSTREVCDDDAPDANHHHATEVSHTSTVKLSPSSTGEAHVDGRQEPCSPGDVKYLVPAAVDDIQNDDLANLNSSPSEEKAQVIVPAALSMEDEVDFDDPQSGGDNWALPPSISEGDEDALTIENKGAGLGPSNSDDMSGMKQELKDQFDLSTIHNLSVKTVDEIVQVALSQASYDEFDCELVMSPSPEKNAAFQLNTEDLLGDADSFSSHDRAARLCQRVYRGHHGRRRYQKILYDEAESCGVLGAMPGTSQGTTGWYQEPKSHVAHYFVVLPLGEWQHKVKLNCQRQIITRYEMARDISSVINVADNT